MIMSIFSKEMSVGRTGKKSCREYIGNGLRKEIVSEHLFDRKTMTWIFLEHLGDEVLGSGCQGNMIGKRVITHFDTIICGLHIVSLERRASH